MPATNPITDSTDIPISNAVGERETITIAAAASKTEEYVAGGPQYFTPGGARILPWSWDDLTTSFGDSVYDRMLFDPVIKAAHVVMKKSILAQGMSIRPPERDSKSDRDRAQKIADRVKRNLTVSLETPIEDVLLNMSDAFAFGYKIAELVWELSDTGQDKGNLNLKAIKVKSRRTVAFVVDRYLNIVGLVAVPPGVGNAFLVGSLITGSVTATPQSGPKPEVLPREKFAIFTHDPADSDPRGTSYLRSAYSAWWGKMQLIPEYLRYLGQFGTPSLVGYTSPGATTVTSTVSGTKQTVSAQVAMQNALVAFRNGSTLALPAGSKVEVLMAHMNPRSFTDDFAHFNREITVGILCQELATGAGAHDSRAAAQVHQDVLGTLIRQGKKSLAKMVTRDIITPMVLYNEGEGARDLIPECSFGETNEPDIFSLYSALGQLGFELSPSQFAALDQMLNLPQRSEVELQALMDRATQVMPTMLDPTKPTPQQQRLTPENPPPSGVPAPAATTPQNARGGNAPKTNRNNNAKG